MTGTDSEYPFEEKVFTFYAPKNGGVLIYWGGKLVKTLGRAEAQKFLSKITGLEGKEAQLVMAKATGNFKRGNERIDSPKR